jgi:Amt family ammonium transporter
MAPQTFLLHLCATDISCCTSARTVGPRVGFGQDKFKPHNIVYTVIGGSLLWVGWFGFNAGSAVSASPQAGMALMVTQICAATSGFTWMLIEYITQGKPSVLGIVK